MAVFRLEMWFSGKLFLDHHLSIGHFSSIRAILNRKAQPQYGHRHPPWHSLQIFRRWQYSSSLIVLNPRLPHLIIAAEKSFAICGKVGFCFGICTCLLCGGLVKSSVNFALRRILIPKWPHHFICALAQGHVLQIFICSPSKSGGTKESHLCLIVLIIFYPGAHDILPPLQVSAIDGKSILSADAIQVSHDPLSPIALVRAATAMLYE